MVTVTVSVPAAPPCGCGVRYPSPLKRSLPDSSFLSFLFKESDSACRDGDTALGQRQHPYLGTSLLEVAGHCSAFSWYLNTCQRLCEPVPFCKSLMLTLLTCGPQSTTVTWRGFGVRL